LVLFGAGLLILGFGTARPHASIQVPSNSTSILLAIDVSRSMCSTDVSPNRLTAAREAARKFVQTQKGGTRIGLVAFSGIAGVLVAPTTDKEALLVALDGLRTARGTAIGQAILTSIDAIAEVNPDVARTGVVLEPEADAGGGVAAYQPDTIVVLTDGVNTEGVDPVTAAEQAQARGLRVYTIGFGTTEPGPSVCSPDQISDGGGFRSDPGGRFGGGFGRTQEIDEDTLTKVADLTGGEYFRAQDAEQLSDVLTDLPGTIVTQRKNVEVTVWFVLAGMLFVLAAVGLSVWWNRSLGLRGMSGPAA
jgi:Ca-activated chloride channel family protein